MNTAHTIIEIARKILKISEPVVSTRQDAWTIAVPIAKNIYKEVWLLKQDGDLKWSVEPFGGPVFALYTDSNGVRQCKTY